MTLTPRHATATASDSGIGKAPAVALAAHEHQPRVGSGPYDAAEHGLGGLMKTFAIEVGQDDIPANSVAPGEICPPVTGQEDQDPHDEKRPGAPLGRPGDARAIAAVITIGSGTAP